MRGERGVLKSIGLIILGTLAILLAPVLFIFRLVAIFRPLT